MKLRKENKCMDFIYIIIMTIVFYIILSPSWNINVDVNNSNNDSTVISNNKLISNHVKKQLDSENIWFVSDTQTTGETKHQSIIIDGVKYDAYIKNDEVTLIKTNQ